MREKKVSSNFGKWGWSMIIYAAVSYYFAAGIAMDGLNFFPTAFQGLYGWDSGLIVAITGISGWIGILGGFLFSYLVDKKGTKFTAVIGNILTGLTLLVFALTDNFIVFLISTAVLVFLTANIQLTTVPNNLMNIWFPKKKGIALGWATMGLPICTASFVAIMTAATAAVGIKNAYLILAIIVIIFGIISFFWIKDTPESLGLSPDNEKISIEEAKKIQLEEENNAKEYTVLNILKTGNTWLIGFGLGILWLVTVGIVSQLIPRLLGVGFGLNQAILLLTVAAIFGILGSYFWGWLDQKIGTKKACIVYSCWYIIALILLIINISSVFTYVAVFFVGVGIGGIGNLIPSMIGSCFGRYGFIKANRIIAPINTFTRCSAFVITGIVLSKTGSFNIAYIIFIGLSVLAILLISLIKMKPAR